MSFKLSECGDAGTALTGDGSRWVEAPVISAPRAR
jgi:hypothetical protein